MYWTVDLAADQIPPKLRRVLGLEHQVRGQEIRSRGVDDAEPVTLPQILSQKSRIRSSRPSNEVKVEAM